MTSPIGALLMTIIQDVIYAALFVSDCDECGFNDLGKLLFGGLIVAIVVGVAISILYRRVKDRSNEQTAFVSIRSNDRNR
jgi:hypothetical protein